VKKRPLIIGDSHAIIMAKSFGNLSKDWDEKIDIPIPIFNTSEVSEIAAEYILLNNNLNKFYEIQRNNENIRVVIEQKFSQKLLQMRETYNQVYLLLDGSHHTIDFSFVSENPFDFELEGINHFLQNGCQIIRENHLYDHFCKFWTYLIWRIVLIKKHLPLSKINLVAPPPPNPTSDYHTTSGRGCNGQLEGEILNKWIRLKIYKTYCKYLSNAAAATEINYCGAPLETLDSCGFLLNEYFGVDFTHSTTKYYQLIRGLEYTL
jgi:hypothetical protein